MPSADTLVQMSRTLGLEAPAESKGLTITADDNSSESLTRTRRCLYYKKHEIIVVWRRTGESVWILGLGLFYF